VAQSFLSAGIPVTKEPAGLHQMDRKHPRGLSLVPWLESKSLFLKYHCDLSLGRVIYEYFQQSTVIYQVQEEARGKLSDTKGLCIGVHT